MNWAWEHRGLLLDLATEHMYLAFVAGADRVAARPAARGCSRTGRPGLRRPLRLLTGVLLAIPSIALFVFLPGVLGTEITDRANVIVALALFVVAVIFRSVVDGLASGPAARPAGGGRDGLRPRRDAARRSSCPIACPTIVAGLRKATVGCIALVCLGAIIGFGGLGQLFTDGFLRRYETEVLVGAALTVRLAVGADQFFVRLQKALLPWARLVPVR